MRMLEVKENSRMATLPCQDLAEEGHVVTIATNGRTGSAFTVVLKTADLTLHMGSREVQRGARKIELTRTEYIILELLMRNAGRVLTRDALIESVWGGDSDIESNTLDAFVRLLRSKIEQP